MNSQWFFVDGDLFYSMLFPCLLVKLPIVVELHLRRSLVLPPHDFGSRLPVPLFSCSHRPLGSDHHCDTEFGGLRDGTSSVQGRWGRVPVRPRRAVHGWPYSNDHHGGPGSSYSPQPCTMWGFMWNHVKPGRFFSYIIFAAWFGLCPAWTFCVHRHAKLHS